MKPCIYFRASELPLSIFMIHLTFNQATTIFEDNELTFAKYPQNLSSIVA
jgi:hypothetical protein